MHQLVMPLPSVLPQSISVMGVCTPRTKTKSVAYLVNTRRRTGTPGPQRPRMQKGNQGTTPPSKKAGLDVSPPGEPRVLRMSTPEPGTVPTGPLGRIRESPG